MNDRTTQRHRGIAALGASLALVAFAGCSAGSVPATSSPGAAATLPASTGATATAAAPTAATPTAVAYPALTLLWEKSGPTQAQGSTYWPAIDPITGDVWVSSPFDNKYWIFKPDGTYVRSWGQAGTGDGQLDLVSHVATPDGVGAIAFAPDGSFFVADEGNFRVQKFDKDGHFVLKWGTFGTDNGQFASPKGIQTDGKVVYVADDSRNDIQAFDTSGKFLRIIPIPDISTHLGPNGHLYAHDNLPGADVQLLGEFDTTGKLLKTYPSQPFDPALTDGSGVAGLTVEKDGTIVAVIGDRSDTAAPCLLIKISPAGVLAGPWSTVESCESITLAPDEQSIYVAYTRGTYPAGTTLRKFALP